MKKFLLVSGRCFAIFLASMLVLVALAPSLASIQSVHQFALSCINRSISGKVTIQDLSVGWFNGVKIEGLSFVDAQGTVVARCQNIFYNHSLLSLLYAPRSLGKIEIHKPTIQLTDTSEKPRPPIPSTPSSTKQKPAPKTETKPVAAPVSLAVTVDDGMVVIAKSDEPEIRITELSCTLDIQEGKSAEVQLSCNVQSGEQPGALQLNGAASNLSELVAAYEKAIEQLLAGKKVTSTESSPEVSLQCKIEHFPVTVVDSLLTMLKPQYAKVATKAIGPVIDGTLSHSFSHDTFDFSANIHSKQLKLFTKEGVAHLLWNIEPALFKECQPFLPSQLPADLVLDKPIHVQAQVTPSMPASLYVGSEAPVLLKSAEWSTPVAIDGKLHLTAASINDPIQATGSIVVTAGGQQASGKIEATLKDLAGAPSLAYNAITAGNWSHLISFFSKNPEGNIFGKNLVLKSSGSVDNLSTPTGSGTLNLQSEYLAFDMDVKKEQDKAINLAISSTLHLEKAPQRWQELLGSSATLTLKTPIEIGSDTIELPTLQATVTSTKELVNCTVDMPIKIDLLNKKIDSTLQLRSQNNTMRLQSALAIDASQLSIHSKGTIEKIPTALLGAITNNTELATLLGRELSGDWNAQFDSQLKQQYPCLLNLHGEGLSLELALSLGKKIAPLSKKEPFILQWELTPSRFQALSRTMLPPKPTATKKLLLAKPSTVTITCAKITTPSEVLMQQYLNLPAILDALRLDLSVKMDKLEFTSEKIHTGSTEHKPRREHLFIDPIEGTATLQGNKRTLQFGLHTKNETSQTTSSAQLDINGEVQNLWNDTELQPTKATVKMRATIKDFPLDVLQMEEVVAVVGPKMNAEMDANISQLDNGTFRGNISTPRIHSSVAFDLQKGNIKLSEPLTAQYELTKEAGEVLLKGINPLLASAARSESPIKLWVDNKDFNMSINPFSLKDLVIKTVKIDPGVLTVKNKGFISPLISLLKISAPNGEIPMWFTPLYIEVKHGTVTCSRADALLGRSYPVATWGKIDLINNQMDMVLGLSGQALSRAFGITTLDPEYLVQIPVKGTVQAPKFDTGRATAKITGLKLQKNKSNATALLGGLLEAAAAAGSKEAKPPAPTTYPFPWNTNSKKL